MPRSRSACESCAGAPSARRERRRHDGRQDDRLYRDDDPGRRSGGRIRPAARPWRATVWRRPLIIGVGGLIGLAIAIFTDGDNPLDALKGLLDKQMAGMTLVLLVALVLFLAGSQRSLKIFNRVVKRRQTVQSRRTHPAVDAGDPTLPMTRTYRFDETGMTTATAFDELWEGWPRITGLDETADLMIVRIGNGAISYPLPKRELAPELRARLQRYVDSRSSSKWPF